MSNVNAEIKWQGNDNAWFTANASTVYPANIQIFHIDGRYKFTDGVTTLSALPFLGGNSYILTDAEIGSVINSAASATPNDTDLVISVESSVAKKNTWTQIKVFLKTYFDILFVKKGTLTTNYIPKATASDTIGDSQIFDNGTNVGIGTDLPVIKLHVVGDILASVGIRSGNVAVGAYSFWNSSANEITTYKSATGFDLKLQELGGGDVLLPNTSSKLNIANLTPSQIVGTDASKNLVSIPFGTTAGTVMEGNGAPAETVNTIGTLINGSTAAVPNDTDLVATADTSVLKKITWSNVKAFLKTYFDTIYQSALGYTAENTANKSSSYTVSSTTTYANTKALVDGLGTKQDTLSSGTNIKTFNGASILGSGAIAIPCEVQLAASDESTALTAGTAKISFRMPFAMTVTEVRASLVTAQASGSIFTVDINEAGTSIISTKITIDNTELTSTTAATPPVISDNSLADDALITVDIDQIGDGTAKGLKILLKGTRT